MNQLHIFPHIFQYYLKMEPIPMGVFLNIKTKHPGKISNTLSPEFRTISPLGYQRRKKFYAPAYTPESIPESETGATLQWLPAVDLTHSVELPIPVYISPSGNHCIRRGPHSARLNHLQLAK